MRRRIQWGLGFLLSLAAINVCFANWQLVFKNGTMAEIAEYKIEGDYIHVTNALGAKFKFLISEIDTDKTDAVSPRPIFKAAPVPDRLPVKPNNVGQDMSDKDRDRPANPRASKLDLSSIDRSFLAWSKKDCQRIIRKSTKLGTEGTLRHVGKVMLSAHTITKTKDIYVTWLTDSVLKAIIRTTQLEERQPDEFALNLYGALLAESKQSHLLFVQAEDTYHYPWSAASSTVKGNIENERQQVIFLQQKNNKDRFSRIKSMDKDHAKTFNFADTFPQYGERAILAFSRRTDSNEPLVTSLDDDLELVIPTKDAGTIKIPFKPKSFVNSLDEL